jgi:hypothetical protein
MDTVSETGALADQAQARLDAVYRQALAEGGINLDELAEIERLGSTYSAAYGEHVAATEQVANLAATAAAVAVGVLVAAASGGALGPAAAAALGGGNLGLAALIGGSAVAAARVGTSEAIGGSHYDTLSAEGARDAATGLAEGATNVLAAGLVARFSSFVGVGGHTLSERLAAGTIAAGEAALPAGARSVTVAAGHSAVENFLAGAAGGVVMTAADEKTWRQSVDDVLADFAGSFVQGGVPAAFGGAVAGSVFEALAARGGIVRAQRLLTGLTEAGLDRARLERLPVGSLTALADVDAALAAGRLDDAARALSTLSDEVEADELERVWTTLGRRHLGSDPPPLTVAPEPPAAAAMETPATVAETPRPVEETPTPVEEPPAPVAEPPAAATVRPAPGGTPSAGEELARVNRANPYLESPAPVARPPAPVTVPPGITVARPVPSGTPPAGEDFARVFRRAARAVRSDPAVRAAARRIETEQFTSLGPTQLATARLGGGADIVGSAVAERSRRWSIRRLLGGIRDAMNAPDGGGMRARIRAFVRPQGVGQFMSLGRPGSIQQRLVMPGDDFNEWVGSLIGPGQSRVAFPGRGGRYPDIARDFAGLDERDIARQIRGLISEGRPITGNPANPGQERSVATRLAYLMFGRETARRPENAAHAAMTLQLIERGEMTFAEAFAQFEPGPGALPSEVPSGGAYPVSRVAAGSTAEAVERETRRREAELAWRWLVSEASADQAVIVGGAGVPRILTPELGGSQDLEDYVTRKLFEFYGLNR